jgi:hypothetical protein
MKPRYDSIPEELRALPNWLVWRLETRSGKNGARQTKVPYCVATGRLAKSNDPTTWSTFTDAAAALKRGNYSGLGFCLAGEYVGVDLDGCRKNGTNEPWAEEIVHDLGSYTELSVSGTGLHIIVRGTLPDGPRQKNFDAEHHGVGLYDSVRGRYLTMSGVSVNGTTVIAERTEELRRIHARLFPTKPKSSAKTKAGIVNGTDDDLIERARRASDNGKFSRLWEGRWEGEYASQSEADLGLCMRLAFWANRDAARIDALFRRSGLMREKWERQDYREATITQAIERTSETWQPKPRPVAPCAAVIDLSRFQPSLELLNGMAVWQGRVQFTSVKRRGPMVIATTTAGVEVVWQSTAELGSFAKSQAVISDASSIWIPTPPHRQIRTQWEPAVSLLLQLSAQDGLRLEPALKEEIRDLLRLVWRAAGQPAAGHSGEFIDFLRTVERTRRNPAGTVPPCVFLAEDAAWVHVPSFRLWLSIPALTNRLPALTDVRNGLLLLGFTYHENLSRGYEGDSETACLWRGPLEVLEG